MSDVDLERGWLERELAELRSREAHYRERLSRSEAVTARLRAHSQSLHQLFCRRPPTRGELARTLVDVARLSAQALNIGRTSVWYFDATQRYLRCELLLLGDVDATPAGLVLTCEDYAQYVKAVGEGSALAVQNVYEDPRTTELTTYLREHRIGALLDIPIVVPGSLLGVVCHEHVGGPRVWEAGEIEFASTVGHLVALSLESERRVRAEHSARGTEAKYQHLVESLPVTVYSFDVHTGKLEYVSPRAFELAGVAPQTWLSQGVGAWLHRIHPEDRAPVMARFERGAAGGFPEEVTYRVTLDDGRTRFVRDTCRVVRDHAGEALAIQGVLADVTEHSEAQLARQEAERRYRALLENVDVIALSLDAEGRVTFANDAWVRISGFSREELIGLDWFEVALPPATRHTVRKRFLEDIARGSVSVRFELGIITRSGEARQLLSTNTLLRGADGTPQGTLSLALDVTHRRNLESELLQQTKLESLGRLAAGVAHDFNNLLMVMLGQLGVLKKTGVHTAHSEAANSFAAIDRAVEQATNLTRSLLLYGRKQPAKNELISLDELVREAMPLLAALAGRGLQLSTSLHAPDAQLMFDRTRVRQVLLNLVGNAADATAGSGSSIRIGTHLELIEDLVARSRGAASGGEFVVLSVADDGRGMDPQTLGRIFDPFFTTKADGRGTGLGLAITQTVANQAGGFVNVQSALGQGTTFRVYLPTRNARTRSSIPSGQLKSSRPPPMPGLEKLRVLVVDDVAPIRELVSDHLTRAGYDAIAVPDSRSATEMLGSSRFDLLLTDVRLHDGSGLVLARSARAAHPALRVVLMSGSVAFDDLFDGTLSKPFDEATLLQVVRDALAHDD